MAIRIIWSILLLGGGLSVFAHQLPHTGSIGSYYEADFGDEFTIDCTARLNSPLNWTAEWYQNDSDTEIFHQDHLDNSTQLLPNGSLKVTIQKWEDEGFYYCVVGDIMGEKLRGHRTHIEIIRLDDEWEIEPVNYASNAGRVARFQCQVSIAVPTPEYRWTHNSFPISNDSRFVALSSGILHILNVTEADAGVYQCIAENRRGSISSSPATLSVKIPLVPPARPQNVHQDFYVAAQPRNQSIPLRGVATLECLVERQKITQTADGQEETTFVTVPMQWRRLNKSDSKMKALDLQSGRIIVTPSTLTIKDFTELDAGMYFCGMASNNKRGDISPMTMATLKLKYSPSFMGFQEAPRSGAFSSGVTVRLQCSVSAWPAPRFRWFYNGEEIIEEMGNIKFIPHAIFPPDRMLMPITGIEMFLRAVVISGMEPRFEGVYQCSVSNDLGEITAAARVLFRRQDESDADLLIPVDVRAKTISEKVVRISWKNFQLDDKIYDVKRLILEYTPAGQTVNTEVVDPCYEAECSFDCCNSLHLQPFTNYTFRLRLVYEDKRTSKIKLGDFSSPVSSTTSEGYALSSAPLSVSRLSVPESLQLSWTELDKSQIQGKIRDYTLEYYDIERPEFVTKIESIPPQIKEYRVKNLSLGKIYNFRVIPATKMGLPKHMDDKAFPWMSFAISETTNDKSPPPTISGVKIVNETTVLIAWSTDKIDTMMRVAWEEINGSQKTSSLVKASLGTFVISNLKPKTQYRLTLANSNIDGNSGLEASHIIGTYLNGVKSGEHEFFGNLIEPPFGAECEMTTSSSIRLKWDKSVSTRNITAYQVRITMIPLDTEENLNASTVLFVNVNDLFFNATNLLPGRQYSFAVRSIDHLSFMGFFTNDIHCSTMEEKPSEPLNLSILAFNSGNVRVSWRPPLNPNGVIQDYIVTFYNSVDGEVSHHRSGPKPYTTVSLSRVGVAYSFEVAAENRAGLGKQSARVIWDDEANPATQGQVIVVASYKEGIIIGVGIALVFLCVCVAILCCRERLIHYIIATVNSSHISVSSGSPKKYVSHGCSPGESQYPVVELQTLISAATVNANGDQADPMDSEHSECCKDSRHCALIQRTPSSENGVDLAALNENDQVYKRLLDAKACPQYNGDSRSPGALSLNIAIDNTSALSSNATDSSVESLADVVVTIESPNDLVPDESNKRHRRRAVSHPVCTDGTVVESPNHHNNKAASQNFSDSGIGIEDSVHQHRTTDMSFSQSNCAIDSGDRFASPVRTTTVL